MTASIIALWLCGGQAALAESACDSGCDAGPPWNISPQDGAEDLPTNTRLLILGEDSPSVKDSGGAVVTTSTEPAPGGGLWLTATAGWTAGETYTLVSTHSSSGREFTIGDSDDTSPPTVSEVELSTRDKDTCDATIPLWTVVPQDLHDDVATRGMFAEVRVSGAADSAALWSDASPIVVTIEEGDSCFPGLGGVARGDDVTLEIRWYDQAGNASELLTTSAMTFGTTDLDSDPASGGGADEDPKTCGCAQSSAQPQALAALGALACLLLLGRRTPQRASP